MLEVSSRSRTIAALENETCEISSFRQPADRHSPQSTLALQPYFSIQSKIKNAQFRWPLYGINRTQKTEPDPAILTSSPRSFATYEFVALPHEKPFPANILSFRQYSGLKALSICLFLWTAINFSVIIYRVTFHRNSFVEQAKSEIENRGYLKKIWDWTKDTLWQKHPQQEKIHDYTERNIHYAIYRGLFLLSVSWTFVWACFDWRNVKYLVFAIASFGFGILYNFTPGHMIDNEIPVVGETETAAVDAVAGGLSLAAIAEHLKKRRHRNTINRLIQDSLQAAITIALEEYGIIVNKSENTTPRRSS